jgi:hypothetical protein
MFQLLFDPSILNVLMFEYQILDNSHNEPPTSEQMITGFINPDTAQTQGIANQWIIPVPATGNDYITNTSIRIRVYPSNGLNVTEWSNSLEFYNPPKAPVVFTARYDENAGYYYNDQLWVLLNDISGNGPDLKYMLAFYYYNVLGETVWKVSDLLDPDYITYETGAGDVSGIRLNCPLEGDVSTDPTKQIVYVAAHAVYDFTYSSTEYYTISEISNTVEATRAEFTAPVLADISYNYTNQEVELDWLPPSSSYLPFYAVEKYNIYYYTDPSAVPTLLDEVSGNVLTYTYTNTNLVCGTTIYYYVEAISETGAPSQQSNVQSIQVFTAAGPPATLYVDWAIYNSPEPGAEVVSFAFTFTNPTVLGCGAPQYFEWVIAPYGAGTTPLLPYKVGPNQIPYDENAPNYNVITSFTPDLGVNYKAFVRLVTIDPNTSEFIGGAWEDTDTITATAVPLIYNIVPFPAGPYTGAGFTFNVASSVLVAPECQLIYGPNPAQLSHVAFDIYSYSTNEPKPPPINAYIYTCSILWSDLGLTVEPKFGIAVSNLAGVGVGIFNPFP